MEAWNDGVIRGFALKNGDVVFTIPNGHAKPVSAITITNDGTKLISGGCDGQVNSPTNHFYKTKPLCLYRFTGKNMGCKIYSARVTSHSKGAQRPDNIFVHFSR